MQEYIQVITTCEYQADAEKIAEDLIHKNLAACVQVIGPIVSTYRWQGNIEKAQEWICFIKTKRKLYPELESAITAIHPYETPEIIALPIIAGSSRYLNWLDDCVRS
jgi:periplasmic divalent cation tolerance protein